MTFCISFKQLLIPERYFTKEKDIKRQMRGIKMSSILEQNLRFVVNQEKLHYIQCDLSNILNYRSPTYHTIKFS